MSDRDDLDQLKFHMEQTRLLVLKWMDENTIGCKALVLHELRHASDALSRLEAQANAGSPSIPSVSWEYIGEELALFWESPYGHGKEKIATFWWPCHPMEATQEVERAFEAIAESAVRSRENPASDEGAQGGRARVVAESATSGEPAPPVECPARRALDQAMPVLLEAAQTCLESLAKPGRMNGLNVHARRAYDAAQAALAVVSVKLTEGD